MELSAASAFEGLDVPEFLLKDFSPPEHWREHLTAGTLWVAVEEGEIIGFLAATPEGRRLHVDEIDVERRQQGKGVGRRLLSDVIAWARANGFHSLSLTTFRAVPWNAPFYASLGFEIWDADEAPASVRAILDQEAARGLTDRCAMRLSL